MNELEGKLRQQEQINTVQDQTIADQNQQIADLNQRIADQDRRIAEQDRRIADQDRKIAIQNQRIDGQNQQIDAQNRTIQNLQRQQTTNENRITQLEHQMATILNVPSCNGCNNQMALHQMSYVCWQCRYVCKDQINLFSHRFRPRIVLSKSHRM